MREIIISDKEGNQRLDKYLLKYLNNAPKSFIYKMLRKKNIKLNGRKAEGSEILVAGDILNLYLAEDTIDKFSAEKVLNYAAGDIEIIYEDENIIAVNKPAGVLSHPDDNDKSSVIDKILLYLYDTGEYDITSNSAFTPGLCNRLDRNTTGIMLCGKNLPALQELNRIIREKDAIEKYYLALVKGYVSDGGILKGYHVKDSRKNRVSIADKFIEGAAFVHTEYEPVYSNTDYSLITIRLITGKSHQIRAHLSYKGHPIVGDSKYGDAHLNRWAKEQYNISGQLLHAERILFKIDFGLFSYLGGNSICAPLPDKFKNIAESLFDYPKAISEVAVAEKWKVPKGAESFDE